jgi:hypothetical protein
MSRDTSVGIPTDYGLDGLGSNPVRDNISVFSIKSRLALPPPQPPIQWVLGVKRQGREADHSPPSDADFKNVGAIPPLTYTPS